MNENVQLRCAHCSSPATSQSDRSPSGSIYSISVVPTVKVQYGVYASSAYVVISSVNVDSGGNIWKAGMVISSWTNVDNSSVTV